MHNVMCSFFKEDKTRKIKEFVQILNCIYCIIFIKIPLSGIGGRLVRRLTGFPNEWKYSAANLRCFDRLKVSVRRSSEMNSRFIQLLTPVA